MKVGAVSYPHNSQSHCIVLPTLQLQTQQGPMYRTHSHWKALQTQDPKGQFIARPHEYASWLRLSS